MSSGRLVRITTAGLALGIAAAAAGSASGATLTGVVASGSPGVASATNPTLGTASAPQSGAARAIAGSTVTLFHAREGRAVRLGRATTDTDGAFTLDYRRPPGRQVLYAIARGGTVAGAPAGSRPGNAIRLMSVVAAGGPALRSVSLTELTTVSSAFALAQFLSGARVSGPSPGLPNAAATAGNLIDQRTGKLAIVLANSPNGNATEALPTFNTIGNILARCTRGTRADCARVFAAATPPGRARPRDTLAAALNMARRPTHATRRLFLLRRTVFRPALRAAPNAWVLSLVYTAGGFDAPGRIAFDSKGRIWSNNNFEPPGTAPGRGVVVLSPTGRPILGSPVRGGGLNGSGFGIAVGPRDRVWVANFGGDSLSLFSPNGRALSGPRGFTAGALADPQGLAIDARGNVWVPNQRAEHVTLYPNGRPAAARQISGGGIINSFAIAIDGRRDAWVTNGSVSPDPAGESSVTKINADGTVDTSVSPIRGGGLLSPMGIAVDSAGNKWVGNLASSSVTVIAPDGTIRDDVSPIRTGSIRGGWGVAVDGSDNVWVASFLDPRVTQLCGRRSACPPGVDFGEPISPAVSGFTNRGLQHVTGVQVDQSGNVWAVNNWSTSSPFQRFVGGNGLVQFIGLATPVAAPLIGLPRRP